MKRVDYIPLQKTTPLVEQCWPPETTPIVSVCCATYNHENFIESAINGFLIQETTFPVEILIHDDGSADETTSIIRRYEATYPQLIRPIYQSKNQYSVGRRPLSSFILPRAKGKYIAICEGDDYWTDPRKLQLQCDFLENNSKYVMSGHRAVVFDLMSNLISNASLSPTTVPIREDHRRDCSSMDICLGKAWVPTMSMMIRKSVLDSVGYEWTRASGGDTFITVYAGQFGDYKFHNEINPAVYRRHIGGVWSSLNELKKMEHLANTRYWIYRYFARIGREDLAEFWRKEWVSYVLRGATVNEIAESIGGRNCAVALRIKIFRRIKMVLNHFLGHFHQGSC